jgi:3-oxocholest-4-en-26-oyl-CoA dehydrogenase alpha subunit
MEFAFTGEEQALIQEIREYLNMEVTPELLVETRQQGPMYGGPLQRKFFQKFGARGWITPTWPKVYGGLDASEMVQYLIRDELSFVFGCYLFFCGAHIAGPAILRFGNEEMKKKYLPPIARGEVEFALGYTEPDAGSDVLALRTKAEDKGDFFVVDGQKTFSTSCHVAEYHLLGVRTDLDAPKRKGISLLVVDLKSPGITINPMITMGGYRTNEVFYDNVIVPKENLLGEKNKGAYYMMVALDFERMLPPSASRKLFGEIVQYSKETVVNGEPLSKNPVVRQKLAEIAVELEVARLLYYRLPYMIDKGMIPNYQSSMQKTFACELSQKITQIGMEILGHYGLLKEGSKWAPLGGRVEHYYRMSVVETIYGGTSEIQRNIVAQRGLGLPRE